LAANLDPSRVDTFVLIPRDLIGRLGIEAQALLGSRILRGRLGRGGRNCLASRQRENEHGE
jgi:hypothetical protein